MRCPWFFALLLVGLGYQSQRAPAAEVKATVTKDGVEFKSGAVVVAKYVTDPKYPKPFLVPVLAPGNVPFTRGFPIEPAVKGGTDDHVHHKSVWFCHGDVVPEGV